MLISWNTSPKKLVEATRLKHTVCILGSHQMRESLKDSRTVRETAKLYFVSEVSEFRSKPSSFELLFLSVISVIKSGRYFLKIDLFDITLNDIVFYNNTMLKSLHCHFRFCEPKTGQHEVKWRLPDFSGCVADSLKDIYEQVTYFSPSTNILLLAHVQVLSFSIHL